MLVHCSRSRTECPVFLHYVLVRPLIHPATPSSINWILWSTVTLLSLFLGVWNVLCSSGQRRVLVWVVMTGQLPLDNPNHTPSNPVVNQRSNIEFTDRPSVVFQHCCSYGEVVEYTLKGNLDSSQHRKDIFLTDIIAASFTVAFKQNKLYEKCYLSDLSDKIQQWLCVGVYDSLKFRILMPMLNLLFLYSMEYGIESCSQLFCVLSISLLSLTSYHSFP